MTSVDLGGGLDLWRLLSAAIVGLWLGALLVLTRAARTSLSGPLLALAVCAALWSLGDLVAELARDPFWDRVGVAVLYTGAIFLPSVWWILSLRWADDRGVPPPLDIGRWSRLPLLFAGVMWLAMLTDPWHGQFLIPSGGERRGYGPLWWTMALPNYLLILGAIAVELRVLGRLETRRIRLQGATVIAASGGVLIANIAYVTGTGPDVNATLPVLAAAAVILVVGMLRQGLYEVLPVALPVIASSDPDGLLVVERDGRLVHANPRAREVFEAIDIADGSRIPAIFAARLTQTDGTCLDRSAPDWEARWWQRVLAPGGVLFQYDRGDAAPWLRMSAEPVRGRNDRLVALCLRVHDATDERRAELEVRRARRLESVAQLSRGVAHDFHNLMMVARGNADLLLDQLPQTASTQRKLQRILVSCEQAADLAHQLQLYAGAVPPARRQVDLSELARQSLELLESDACGPPTDGSVDVGFHRAAEPLLIDADETQLRQLLLNLFVNARDALGERGGRIDVTVGHVAFDPAHSRALVLGRDQPAARYAFLRVADTGSGMDPETQERVFEPFFSTKGKHTGIGLATVFGVARSHGALMELESEPGRGTVFTVYLPLVGAAAA